MTRLRVVPTVVASGLACSVFALLLQARPNAAAPAWGARIPTPTAAGFPSPPSGAVVFAREDGENVLALAVRPGREGKTLLQSSVVGPDGIGVSNLPVGFVVTTRAGRVVRARGAACGLGCYAAAASTGAPRRVAVTVGRHGKRRYSFSLPTPIAHPEATALVRRSGRVWRRLRTLAWSERLASSPHNRLETEYRSVAPDRFAYRIAGGAEAIVIGGRRWDRSSPSGRWARSAQQPPLRQPVPFWAAVRDAHVVGAPTIRGHRVWRVTFFDPGSPAWFSVDLDQTTLRTLSLRMLAAAHFMDHVYRGFDQPLALEPPTS